MSIASGLAGVTLGPVCLTVWSLLFLIPRWLTQGDNHITELRVKKGISEYQLSYDLGHSKNYIHNIVTGYSQPSVKELLYLIDTLGITPRLFFDEEAEYRNPILVQEIIDGIKSMNDQDLEAVFLMVRRLNEKN